MNIFKRVVRIVTYVFLTFCLVGLIFCAVSSDQLEIVNYELDTNKEVNSFTCLVVSDYHHRSLNFSNGNMIDKLKEQGHVDYVFFTGDLIDSYTKSLDDVKEIFEVAKEISDHRYFVTGNHEEYAPHWSELQELMLNEGVEYLNNEEAPAVNNIHIYGLQDVRFTVGESASFKKREEAIKEALDSFTINPDNFNILLVHRPENFKMIADNYPFDMVMSGHTHGGQFKIGNWIPASIALEESEYMGGEYQRNKSTLYVSRGLGHSAMFPIRVNCNPEIVKVTVK